MNPFASPESAYSFFNAIAFFAWLILAIAPQSENIRKILVNILITFFALSYAYLLVSTFWLESFSEFSTLEGLQGLFSDPLAVVTGWIHYLAFDLLTGVLIAKDASKQGFSRLVIPVFLLFTFMAGPLGWLIYWVARTVKTRGSIISV